jgi:sialic acid synthase SpsE
VSNYPADPAEANLRAMDTLARAFDVPVGFSDHTLGMDTACAAVALGARIIEKHFTLDRNLPGPDQRSSLQPSELAAFVAAIRRVESALGDGVKRPMPGEADVRGTARRSLIAAEDLPAGTVLRRKHLAAKRPGDGIPPSELKRVLGMTLQRPLAADEPLSWTHLRYGGGE